MGGIDVGLRVLAKRLSNDLAELGTSCDYDFLESDQPETTNSAVCAPPGWSQHEVVLVFTPTRSLMASGAWRSEAGRCGQEMSWKHLCADAVLGR